MSMMHALEKLLVRFSIMRKVFSLPFFIFLLTPWKSGIKSANTFTAGSVEETTVWKNWTSLSPRLFS